MSGADPFRYDGKRVLVVGGATGMGAAAAKRVAALGGEAVVMDHAKIPYSVARPIQVDLQDRAAIDAAIVEVGGPVDAIFSAAGIADGPALMRVNFIAHRHLVERMLVENTLRRGSAVCFISSVAGLGWEGNLPTLIDFLATPDFDSAVAWIEAHEGTNNYLFSKQAINAYVARQAYPFAKKGVRINAICPGPTDTPLARSNAAVWLAFGQDYRKATGLPHHTPEQMGDTMAFLNSSAASGISGINLLVDSGHVMSSSSGSWEADKPIIDLIMGRAKWNP
jgi:NAD(P)-dependent dehydrogenase (short-subunit alcohol dehydrogenase family)